MSERLPHVQSVGLHERGTCPSECGMALDEFTDSRRELVKATAEPRHDEWPESARALSNVSLADL